MEFCVMIEPHNGAGCDDQLRVAIHAEDLGFAGFFRSDHLIAGDGDGLPRPSDTWITLAALGRETSTIRLGSLMTSATFRHPSLLAVSVAQADQMSGGRVELGLGAGWWVREHAATGIELPEIRERFDRFAEQLEILHGLWSTPVGETYSFSSDLYRLDRAPALPKPMQEQVPIIIGGDGQTRTPELAARWAKEFNSGWENPTVTKFPFDRVAAACTRIGRDHSSIRRSTVQTLCGGDTVADRERRAAGMGVPLSELAGLVGNEGDIRRPVADFKAVGVDRVYVEILDLADLEHLNYFADAVGLQPPEQPSVVRQPTALLLNRESSVYRSGFRLRAAFLAKKWSPARSREGRKSRLVIVHLTGTGLVVGPQYWSIDMGEVDSWAGWAGQAQVARIICTVSSRVRLLARAFRMKRSVSGTRVCECEDW
jgi:F420-dependent oxidoreductase-like protein